MTRLQLLLNKLAEEGTEVAQIALKTAQFGPDEVYPGQQLSNAERIHCELDHLHAQIEMLNDEYGFAYVPNRERIEAKKTAVNHFAAYSESLGMVTTGNGDNR